MASTSFRPGQVLSAMIGPGNVVSGNLVCDEAGYAGSPPVLVGDLPDRDLVSHLKAGINVTATIKKLLTGKIDVSHIKNVRLELSNVHSEAVALAAITTGVETGQTPGCTAAIALMRKKGFGAYLRTIETALRADVSYVVTTEGNVAIDIHSVSTDVGAALGGSYQPTNAHTVGGKNLVIGLMLSPASFVLTRSARP
jgi:L-aminopeptidase/D-esterase-like protein